jgi:hypothetical protein
MRLVSRWLLIAFWLSTIARAQDLTPRCYRWEVRMRAVAISVVIPFLCVISIAGQSSVPAASPMSDHAAPSEPKTIQGCLSGDPEEGYFLGTGSGDLYQVIGKTAWLKQYNGRTVSITGNVARRKASWSASKVLSSLPPTVRPTKVVKIEDTCD